MTIIDYNQFQSVDIRVGTIVKTEFFTRARKPAYKIWVDFGDEIGIKKTSAQITELYEPNTLIGQQILGCINLGEKNIAGFCSEFLLLGFDNGDGAITIATVQDPAPNGNKLQ